MKEYEKNWRTLRDFDRGRIPAAVLDWILDSHSLTQRVRAFCGDTPFRVRVLSLRYRPASTAESCVLKIKPGLSVLDRQVQLCCDERPLVYARSLLPVTLFTGRQQRLKFQGSKSLGATLFSDPSVTRGELQVASVAAGNIPGAEPAEQAVWGRRSVFRIQGKPLLVAEFYLPHLFQ
ncbi:MAG TPA: chorismate lyase [Gammaproteobacteria bacterium]|nr:chorismate lyase [Gammaproteobacteria bacterium]